MPYNPSYPALDAGRYGPGTPIDIADPEKLWGKQDKTNGRVMQNVDGQIPMLSEGFAKVVIPAASAIYDDGAVPWGQGLWLDLAQAATQPHTLYTSKPTKGLFMGILPFSQGWAMANPVHPYGVPTYSKGRVVRKGYIGYKTAMAAVDKAEDFLKFLKGDRAQAVAATRTEYKDWMTTLAGGADGAKLGVFFANDSGFPVVQVVPVASQASPTLAGATFGGFGAVFEPENELVYFDIKGV